jgi:hypothetical protein
VVRQNEISDFSASLRSLRMIPLDA